MRPAALPTHYLLSFALALLGCQPEIGDSCQIHSDCSASGDRLCDPTLPGGYCTVFNCEPGGCPEEAVCVAYQTSLASAAECGGESSRVRTFCMKACSSNGDCRKGDGYACVDLSKSNPWGAAVVERGSHRNKICTVPMKEGAADERSTDVCNPPPYPDAGAVPGAGGPPDAGPEASTADAASPEAGKPEGGPGEGGTDSGKPEGGPGEGGAGDGGTKDGSPADAQDGG